MAIYRIQKLYSKFLDQYTDKEKAALGLGTTLSLVPTAAAGYLELKNRGKGGCPDRVLNAAMISGIIGTGINAHIINRANRRRSKGE